MSSLPPKESSFTPDTKLQQPEKMTELPGKVEDHEYVVDYKPPASANEKGSALGSVGSLNSEALRELSRTSYDDIIKSLNNWDLKPGSPWGFEVYRTAYENDELWARVAENISPENAKESAQPSRFFKLTIIAYEKRFAGADSHTIRQAFHEWVADDLPPRLRNPEEYGGVENLRAMILSHDVRNKDYGHPWHWLPPRWNFCLFIDDICLRSLDHPNTHGPVAKLVNAAYEYERCEAIAEGWEDGETDEPEEDVGWMYVYAQLLVEWYDRLKSPHEWEELYYERPQKTDCPWGAVD